MGLFDVIAIILIISWLGGFFFNIAGSLIHVLLVLAIVMFLVRFIRGGSSQL